jgi:O-antigen/teichoic acid export membrane protein
VLIPLSESLSLMIFSKPDWQKVITWVILASAIQSVNNIINSLMRLQSKSVLYTATNLFKLTAVLLLTVYFIVNRKMGLEGIFLAQVIGNSAVVLFLSVYVIRNSALYFSFPLFREMNAYGFPLFMANIATVMLNVVDRYSLNSQDLLKSVALYTLAFKITSVLKLVIVDSVKLAVGPLMFRKLGSPDAKRFYSKVLLYSSWVLMLGIIAVSVFSYEVIKVMAKSKEFWGAVAIVPILALSVFFVNMKDIAIYGLHFEKRTRTIGLIVVASTLIALALNLLLIPRLGISGAALATLLSQLFYWYACLHFAQKAYYIPYEKTKIALILVTGTVLSFSGILMNGLELLPRLLLKSAAPASFPFILYLLGFYETAEIQAITGFIRKWGRISHLRQNIKTLKGIGEEY